MKPLLRGWSHAVGAVAAVVGIVFAAMSCRGDVGKLVAILVYGASLVVLLGFSALYHIPRWSPSRRLVMRRIDHANIFVMIAGTYTPISAVLLGGAWRNVVLTCIWGIAVCGMVLSTSASSLAMRRKTIAGLYLVMGWLGVVIAPEMIAAVGWATLLMVVGGVLYSLGALAYATRRPSLWPRVFGYHELFHLLVIAASVAFYAFILGWVLPHHSG